jgi:hypothetical protein
MAKALAVIKSFRNGFNIVLDDNAPFEAILAEVGRKFGENAAFFGNIKSAVSFTGRSLTDEEEDALIDAITGHSDVRISCVVVKDDERNRLYLRAMREFTRASEAARGQVHVGNLLSVEKLESPYALTLIGDVNPGALVVSGGCITVLGTLYGEAVAGCAGYEYDDYDEDPENEDCCSLAFVSALDVKAGARVSVGGCTMEITQRDLGNSLIKKNTARIFYERDGRALMESISKEFIENCRNRLL